MISKNIILVGGGGHCKSVIDVAQSAGYSILGILDRPENVGSFVLNSQVIGTDDDIPQYVNKADFLVAIGFIKDPSIRIKVFNRIKEFGGRLATVVASTAYVSKYATLAEGTIIMHHAFVNAGAKVGENCIINTFSNIEHDVIVGDQCHISTGALANGNCRIGQRVFIGSQSVLANDVSIADDVIVGAASFVHKSISKKGIYAGNPAVLKVKANINY